MGWASMNRHWHALIQAQQAAPGLPCACPLQPSAIETPAAPRWQRIIARSITYPQKARQIRTPIVHVLDHSFADLIPHIPAKAKVIVTVHDLIPLLDSSGLSPNQLERYRKRISLIQRADLILAISEFTAKAILQHFPGIAPDRIKILPMGVSLPSVLTPAPRSSRALLSIGSNLGRKNLQILPAVLQQLKAADQVPKLIRIGEKLPTALANEIIQIIGLHNFEELGFVPEQQLQQAYSTATLTFFPSTLEGLRTSRPRGHGT
jgi:glycosyltransferase involved in cell wall biosynthesis